MSAVNDSRSRDAPGARPIMVSAGHASSTYFRKLASAFGAGSVATTSKPRARYCAAQLAPMTPVPTIAIRLIGLSYDIIISPFWFIWFVDFSVKGFQSDYRSRWHDKLPQDPIPVVGWVTQAANVNVRAVRKNSARV